MNISRRVFNVGLMSNIATLPLIPAAWGQIDKIPHVDDFTNSVGVCVHLSYSSTVYGRFDDIIRPRLNELMIKHVRDGIFTDVKMSAKAWPYVRGRKLVGDGILFSCVTNDGSTGPLTDLRRLREAVSWYDDGVAFLEGGNEVNLGKNKNWATITTTYQKQLFDHIKNDTWLKNIPVLGPSLFIPGNEGAGNYSGSVDFGNIHAYPGDANPETSGRNGNLMAFLKSARTNTADKPIVVSETGYHSALQTQSGHPPLSDTLIARYMPRLLLWYWASGVVRTYIYELASTYNKGPADKESNFGLIDGTGTPKPVFFAVKNLMKIFTGNSEGFKAPDLNVSVHETDGDLKYLLFKKSAKSYLLPIWLAKDGWDRSLMSDRPVQKVITNLTVPNFISRYTLYKFSDQGTISTHEEIFDINSSISIPVFDQLSILELHID